MAVGSFASGKEIAEATFISNPEHEQKLEQEARGLPGLGGPHDDLQIDDTKRHSSPFEQIVAQDPNIVNWEGLDDPENPLNWPFPRKVVAISIVSFITFLSYDVFVCCGNTKPANIEQATRVNHDCSRC